MTSSGNADKSDRAALEGELGDVLGFHDVSDVFDHLAQIPDAKDLMGYLSDLLGSQTANTDRVRGFADNMARFGRGEPIVVAAATATPTASSADDVRREASGGGAGARDRKPGAAAAVEDRKKEALHSKGTGGASASASADAAGGTGGAANAKARAAEPAERGGEPAEEMAKKEKKHASAPPRQKTKTHPRQKTPPRKTAQKQKKPQQQQLPQAKNEAAVAKKSAPAKNEPRPPPRGRATVVCGCWGTVHDCLTNCLHCGRIACAEEGYGYCAFCGFLIEEVTLPPGPGNENSATLHKERLLRFDRESARRTVVLDDQEDYYCGASSSSWLDEDERRRTERADGDARREKHERRAPKLNIAF